MNRNQLVLLIAVLAVLGGAGLIVQHSRQQSANTTSETSGKKLLGDGFPVNDVAQIQIKQSTNEINLVKRDDAWKVHERNDYPANFAALSEFVKKAADLKIVQTEEVGPSQLARLQLAAGSGTNSGTVVDFKDKNGKSLKQVTLGKLHMRKPNQKQASPFGDNDGFPDGRYVTVGTDSKQVLVISDPMDSAEPKADRWLDKTFFRIEHPKSIVVTFPAATNSWKISRETETGAWTLADTKPEEALDTNKVTGVSNPFSSASFNDVLTSNSKPEDTGLDKATLVAVETFDDFNYTVKVGKKMGEEYPITVAVTAKLPTERTVPKDEKPEDKEKAEKAWKDHVKQLEDKLKQAQSYEKWTYLVPTWTVDTVMKERKDLLVEKKEEKPADKADAGADKKDEPKPVDKSEVPAGGGGQ